MIDTTLDTAVPSFLKRALARLPFAHGGLDRAALPSAIEAPHRLLTPPTTGGFAVYEQRGHTGGPVILVHSVNAAASAYEMRPLFEALRDARNVVAVELPGFGSSDRPDRRYTREQFRDALTVAFADAADRHSSPVDVVALSLGCEFAAAATLVDPSRVRSLSFLSPTGFSSRPRGPQQRAALTRRTALAQNVLERPYVGIPLFAALASRPSIRYFLSKSFSGRMDEGLARYAYETAHRPGARYAPLAFLSGALFDPDAKEALYARLTVPVQVVYDEDAHVDFGELPDLAERRGWSLTRIAPTRGLPHFERTRDTVTALREFWRELDLTNA